MPRITLNEAVKNGLHCGECLDIYSTPKSYGFIIRPLGSEKFRAVVVLRPHWRGSMAPSYEKDCVDLVEALKWMQLHRLD